MILVFGGTTEGRMVAQLLDIQQMEFYYSTKLGSQQDVPGRHTAGAMNAQHIVEFCTAHGIRLLVDAAHPFAVQLHENISQAAALLGLKVVRVERRSPEYTLANVRFFDSWQGMAEAALEAGVEPILALTGVQTIVSLKDLWSSRRCYFRILNTVQSEQLARASGIAMSWIIQDSNSESEEALIELVRKIDAQVILTKDSGYSGGLEAKIAVSQQLEVPLWVLKRPSLPAFDYVVYERKELLMLLLRLKKELLATEELRPGFTTGTCVCAAVKASIIALEDGAFPNDVTVYLADGTPARFAIFPNKLDDVVASCSVIKDAGDDPDVTHAKEVGCTIYRRDDIGVEFKRGVGIGLVTLPGLQVAVGEPAINPVPRKMISQLVEEMAQHYSITGGFTVEPFVPEGEELAKRTFNGRVGVEGGISILGTTGRVFPYSAEAFMGAIRQQVRVARSLGCNEIVATSGKRSESTLKPLCEGVPANAYIHFGNFVGETIKIADEEGFDRITIGIMLGKAVKLAEGHLDTHSREVLLNTNFLVDIAKNLGYNNQTLDKIEELKLANAITDIIPFNINEPFYLRITQLCHGVCQNTTKKGLQIRLALIMDEKRIILME